MAVQKLVQTSTEFVAAVDLANNVKVDKDTEESSKAAKVVSGMTVQLPTALTHSR